MRRLLLGLTVVATVAVVAAQEPTPTFEVATVKRNTSGPGNSLLRRLPGGRLTATNMPVRPMITFAYQLAQYQLVGGPSWISSDAFDVVAKMEGDPAPVAPGTGTDPMQLALRDLLADRFKLKAHRETRQMDIYALVMAKPGGTTGPESQAVDSRLRRTGRDRAPRRSAAWTTGAARARRAVLRHLRRARPSAFRRTAGLADGAGVFGAVRTHGRRPYRSARQLGLRAELRGRRTRRPRRPRRAGARSERAVVLHGNPGAARAEARIDERARSRC